MMPSPTPSNNVEMMRPDLGGSIEEFDLEMDRLGFIGHRVMPVFETRRAAGPFGKIPLSELLRAAKTARASGAPYSRGTFKFEDDNYATRENGHEMAVDERNADLYRDWFDSEVVAAKIALDVVLREHEKRIANKVINSTTWTGSALTTAVGTPWTTLATAAPMDDVEGALQKIWDNSGLDANALVINRKIFRSLRRTQQIIDSIQSGGTGSPTKPTDVTAQRLAEVFDLDFVLVAGGAQNTANEAQATSLSRIWPDANAMVCRIAEREDDITEPCIGRTFHWGEDGSEIGGHMESYYEVTTRADIIRARHETDEKILYIEAGHLLSGIG